MLSPSEATDLLTALGVDDDDTHRLRAWAAGSPLALVLAADAATRPDADTATLLPSQLAGMAGALLEGETDERFADTLAVATVARAVTAAMLHDVLEEPIADAREALAWLAGRTFAERLGEGITLHDVVRRSLLADLRRRDAERERELRRRIADHLHARARAGQPRLAIDLADLIEDRRIRWGFCWEGSARYHVDAVRDGDAEAIGAAWRPVVAARGGPPPSPSCVTRRAAPPSFATPPARSRVTSSPSRPPAPRRSPPTTPWSVGGCVTRARPAARGRR